MSNKYGAVPCEADGYKFASKRERDRYFVLKTRQELGEIMGLQVHPRFDLPVCGVVIGHYTADFAYCDRQRILHPVVEDVKGGKATLTREFQRTRKLMQAIYGIKVRIV